MNPKKRKTRLKELLKRMEAGEDVAQRDLKNVLTTDHRQALQKTWENEKEWRKQFAEKPKEIKEYEGLLKRARFLFNRSEKCLDGLDKRGNARNGATATSLWHQTERALERAWEYLEEILAADPSLRVWFDRDITFTHEKAPAASIETFPHVITSRSLDNRGSIVQRRKFHVKKEAIENSLAEIKADEERAKKGITKEQEQAELHNEAQARIKRLKGIMGKVK